MKSGDTCRHNISKLNSGLSVKLLQLPLQRSGKALEENLEGPCSIFLQKRFIFFFFFCNTSPKPQLQCSQEASPIYIESPTSPSQGSAGRQAGVTAAAGRCKVVNYATKWTSQKWSPQTPRPGAVADNLGVLSGRVPVLSGYPIIRGKHWYIGRETRGSSGGGGVGSGRPGRGGSPTGERRKWHSTRMV